MQMIEGKTLQQLIETLPYGKFEILVRDKFDPLYGRAESDMKLYKVRVKYWFSGHSTHDMEVEAVDEAHAKKEAKRLWSEEQLDFDCSSADVTDYEVDTVKEI